MIQLLQAIVVFLISDVCYATCWNDMGGRIIKGEEAAPNSLPSIVRINIIKQNIGACRSAHCGMCGGTIVNEEWILTAGHCCRAKDSSTPKPPSYFTITIGAHYDETCDHSGLCSSYSGVNGDQVGDPPKEVVEVVMHPQYKPTRGKIGIQWDACLLRVKPFDLVENFAQQVKLPAQHIAPVYPESGAPDHPSCIVAGWGKTEHRNQSPVLLQANTTIFSNQYCNTKTAMRRINENFQFCSGVIKEQAQSRSNQDSCEGDSGGPLYCCVDGNTVQYGIVSWGSGCGLKHKPGIYTSTAAISDWIRETIAADGVQQKFANFHTGYPDSITLNGPKELMKAADKVLKGKYLKYDVGHFQFDVTISPEFPLYFKMFAKHSLKCALIYYSNGAWNLKKGGLAKNSLTYVKVLKERFIATTDEPIKTINNIQTATWMNVKKGGTADLQFGQ